MHPFQGGRAVQFAIRPLMDQLKHVRDAIDEMVGVGGKSVDYPLFEAKSYVREALEALTRAEQQSLKK